MKVNVGHPLLGFLLSSTAEQVFVETHCLLTVVYKLGKDFLQRWHISSRNQQSLYYERPLLFADSNCHYFYVTFFAPFLKDIFQGRLLHPKGNDLTWSEYA